MRSELSRHWTTARRGAAGLLAALLLGLCSVAADAQEFPSRAVTIVVPTAAGGPLDILARLLQPRLTPLLGQGVIVENRPGASTYIGGEYVAKSAPDGHTLLLNANSGLFPELFVKGLTTVQSKELVPVAPLGFAQFLLFTGAQVPAKDLREFVTLVRANPNKYNLAAFSGAYSSLELINFLKANSMEMLRVPYNSGATIITAMLRDEVHLYMGSISGPKANIDAGKLRGLAIVGAKRSPVLPGVPTTKELGFNFDVAGDFILLAPARTPVANLRVLNERIARAMDNAEVRERLAQLGFDPMNETPEIMAAKFARLTQDVHRVVKELGVEPQ